MLTTQITGSTHLWGFSANANHSDISEGASCQTSPTRKCSFRIKPLPATSLFSWGSDHAGSEQAGDAGLYFYLHLTVTSRHRAACRQRGSFLAGAVQHRAAGLTSRAQRFLTQWCQTRDGKRITPARAQMLADSSKPHQQLALALAFLATHLFSHWRAIKDSCELLKHAERQLKSQ